MLIANIEGNGKVGMLAVCGDVTEIGADVFTVINGIYSDLNGRNEKEAAESFKKIVSENIEIAFCNADELEKLVKEKKDKEIKEINDVLEELEKLVDVLEGFKSKGDKK